MPNSWYKHSYVQGFDCESITFKKSVNMFERMEISESIYEGIVEPSYKKTTSADANRVGHSRENIGEDASLWTCPKNGGSANKCRKRYVESPTGKSKTYLIHGPGNSSEECKVLGDFGTE